MSKQLFIDVKDKIACLADSSSFIVCGNSDYEIVFNFDDEWSEYEEKTALFVANGITLPSVVFQGNICPVPKLKRTNILKVGVSAGDLHTTTSAKISCKWSAGCESGTPQEPAPDVYAQLMQMINDGKIKGEKGDTPTKGVDYWTEADKKEVTDYVDEKIASAGGGEKEVVFCDIGKMLQEQDVPMFLELSQRVEKGECVIVGYLDGQMAIVNCLNNRGNNNIDWAVTSCGESGSGDDVTPFFIGVLVKCVNGEYLDISMHNVYLDFATKTYVEELPLHLTLTDDGKAAWCEWMGAVPKTNDNTDVDVVFGRYSKWGNYAPLEYTVSSIPVWGALLRCGDINTWGATEEEGVSGGIYAPTPKQPFQAANKKYVDDKVGEIETALDSILAIQNTLIGGGV